MTICCYGPFAGISVPGAIAYFITTRGVVARQWKGSSHSPNRVWVDLSGEPSPSNTPPLRQFDRKLIGGKPSGYLSVCLTHNDGVRRNRYVHELVLLAFVGPRPTPDHEALHGNGCRADNWVHNLRWGTVQENADDRERHGNVHRGDAWYRSRGLAPPWVREAELAQVCNVQEPEEPAHAFADLIG